MKKIFLFGLLLAALILSACGSNDTSTVVKPYLESEDGDLSDDRERPTVFQLGTGTTTLSGTTEREDLDYFRISVPEGGVLSEVTLSEYESLDNAAFIAVVEGKTFAVEEDGGDTAATELLGYSRLGPEELNQNLLPLMAEGNFEGGAAPTGFETPLTAGDYSFWVQQTGLETTYTLEFKLDLE